MRYSSSSGASPDAGLRGAIEACRDSFLAAGIFSMFINVLMLLPAIYMLQVYDRVLNSGSQSTLLMLTLIALFLFVVMGGLEWVRSQILILTGTRLDQMLGARVFDGVHDQTVASGGRIATAQPLGDLLQLRQFLTGPGLFAFFDAPWVPIYLAVMFMFHWLIGFIGVASALVLLGLAIWNETATREDLKEANRLARESDIHAQRNLRNAEVIEAMGMQPRLRARWQARQDQLLALQARASRKGGLITAASKTFRQAGQTLILGLGAYLAIDRQISAGAVIAGSILLGRALAPMDQLIATWRGFLGARDSWQRLGQLLAAMPEREAPMPLPPPAGEIVLDKLVITPPGAQAPVLKGISLRVEPGSVLAVIGPSAAGKSTLVRAMLGLYRPMSGSVRLDGAELDQWDREQLGRHVGYLPQDVELLDGTVSENIARFGDVDPDRVVAAASAAGVHEMVLRLPEGYATKVVGNVLSAGQRQRIGLARALYGNPRVIILDEPNSNLDQDGDAALAHTLGELRKSGHTVVVVTHRNNLLGLVDRILLLLEGQVGAYGERDKVLASLQAGARPSAAVAQHPAALRATPAGEQP
jgi:ATP-binding cassette subfamily C protein EexD